MNVLATIGAALAIAGAFAFAVVVGWLHVVRSDVNPRDEGVSHYAAGRSYVAMTAAFVALALGLLGAVVTILERVPSPSALGLVALAGGAAGLLAVAATPVSGANAAGRAESLHTAGALVFFIGSALGAAALSTRLGVPARPIAMSLVVFVALFLTGMAGTPGLRSMRGWLQRGCFALVVAWLLVIGWLFVS